MSSATTSRKRAAQVDRGGVAGARAFQFNKTEFSVKPGGANIPRAHREMNSRRASGGECRQQNPHHARAPAVALRARQEIDMEMRRTVTQRRGKINSRMMEFVIDFLCWRPASGITGGFGVRSAQRWQPLSSEVFVKSFRVKRRQRVATNAASTRQHEGKARLQSHIRPDKDVTECKRIVVEVTGIFAVFTSAQTYFVNCGLILGSATTDDEFAISSCWIELDQGSKSSSLAG